MKDLCMLGVDPKHIVIVEPCREVSVVNYKTRCQRERESV